MLIKRLPRSRRAAALGAAGAVLLLVAGGIGLSAAAPSDPPTVDQLAEPAAGPARPGTPGAPVAQRAVSDITLLTGDRVRLTTLPGGRQNVVPLPPDKDHPGSGTVQFEQFAVDGDRYVVPGSALRSIGSTLDVNLFDVSYLARAGLADPAAGSLPLVATLDPAAGPPAVPGLSVAGGAGAERPATLNKAQAWRLGTALGAANRPGARSAGRGLPGVRHLGLGPAAAGVAGPPTTHGSRPGAGAGLAQRTLTVNTVDRTGAPSIAIVFVQNVDDLRRFFSITVVQGTASFSVPEGNYLVAANVVRFHEDGVNYDAAFVAEPDRSIRGNTTLTLDARTANPITAAVGGKPTAPGLISLAFDRRSATGGDFFFGSQLAFVLAAVGNADSPLSAAPTRPVHNGSFGFQAYIIASAGPTFDPAGSHYLLDFPDEHGIPASVAYDVPTAALTTADETYHWPASATAPTCEMSQGFSVTEPWSSYSTGYFVPLPGATTRTDYLYSPASSVWYQIVQTPACQFYLDSWRHLPASKRIRDDWFAGPLVPTVQRESIPLPRAPGLVNSPAGPLAFHTYGCAACRQDDNLALRIMPFGDAQPGHIDMQEVDSSTTRSTTRFYQNGTLAMTTLLPYAMFPLLPTAANYRLDWDLTRTRADWPLSTDVHTSWTFSSNPASRPDRPPSYVDCLPDTTVTCGMLPLLFVGYDLPLAPDNTVAAGGTAPITVTVSRQEHMAAARGLKASLQLSYDDGATWTAAPVRAAGGGRFTANVRYPALADSNGYVAVRVHAADADGNTVDQTVLRAYQLVTR
ncbi:MAG TPA: hypothetical protein VMU51_25955 [Mycobacteriales bacterium]|nr:hypothetical protein [Mycobacteriales bacterium]